MPKSTATPISALQEICDQLEELLNAAARFVPRGRTDALMGKWLPRKPPEDLTDDRAIAMLADGVTLATDLVVSQPAGSGSTAIDRAARSRTGVPPALARAIAALCKARFRLLHLDGDTTAATVTARDVISRETLRIVGTDLPPLPPGTPVFARVAMLGDGLSYVPGVMTPLDEAAFAVARAHTAAGAAGVSANARWAEAVYAHVVRHGTMGVPGLNRPSETFEDADLDDADEGLDEHSRAAYHLVNAWIDLADDAPSLDLLDRTRQNTDPKVMVACLAHATGIRTQGLPDAASRVERLVLVQMEAILRRERSGSTTLTLDMIQDLMNQLVATGRVPPDVGALFTTLRERLAGRSEARRADDPALERLVQKIQALRAKTVDQGCTEQEALAAAEKVAELLDRHGLSLNELDFRAQPCDGIGIQTNRRRMAPIDGCIPTIAAFFDCKVWVEHARGTAMRYVFFGLRGDVAAAQYLYEMVERAFEVETDAFRAGAIYAAMAGERRTATASFQTGLSNGIAAKLNALRAARDKGLRSPSGRDLVPVKAAMVDEELAKLGLNLHSRAIGGKKRVLTDAYTAGEAAGQRFELNHAIAQAA